MNRTFGLIVIGLLVLAVPKISFGRDCLQLMAVTDPSSRVRKPLDSWVADFNGDYLGEVGKVLEKLESDPEKKDQVSKLRNEIDIMKKMSKRLSREKKYGTFTACKNDFEKLCIKSSVGTPTWKERRLLAMERGSLDQIILIRCDIQGKVEKIEIKPSVEASGKLSLPAASPAPALQ